VYNGAGKVPPAPLSATTGVEAVVVGADVVVVVEVVVEVKLLDVEVVVVEVVWTGAKVTVVVVEIVWVVEVGCGGCRSHCAAASGEDNSSDQQ